MIGPKGENARGKVEIIRGNLLARKDEIKKKKHQPWTLKSKERYIQLIKRWDKLIILQGKNCKDNDNTSDYLNQLISYCEWNKQKR